MDPNVKLILERAKATATYAAEKAGKMADAATKKAGDMAALTKLNLQIFDLNTDIDGLYKDLGRIVYLAHVGDESFVADLDDKFAQIDEKLASLERPLPIQKQLLCAPVAARNAARVTNFAVSAATS